MNASQRITRIIAAATAGAALFAGAAVRMIVHSGDALHDQIREVPGALEDLRDFANGHIQSAIIGTACGAFAQGTNDPDWEQGTLNNLLEETQPPGKQTLDAVQGLVTTFNYDVQNGITTTQQIGLVCQGYQTVSNLG